MHSPFHPAEETHGAPRAGAATAVGATTQPPRRRLRARRGYSLLEAMVATTVFTMVVIGVYSMLIKSYQLAALARCRDDARGVLRTFADQFERLQTTETVGGATYNRWLFNPTGGPSGRGLVWEDSTGALLLSNANTSTAAEDVASITVSLGGSSHATAATLTRDVRYVDPSDGDVSATQDVQAAGSMLMGTFTIKFSRSGKDYTQSLTVLRVAP